MAVPAPVRLFHITAIENLPKICEAKALLAKNLVTGSGLHYANIAHQGAQGSRSVRSVPDPPGGVIHDYVPFYYAPRSPMLYVIDRGGVAGCELRQSDIVHIEATVDDVLKDNAPFVIYDRNATLPYATPYRSLADLNKVAWDLILEAPQVGGFCKYFHDVRSKQNYADRRERRMAEFLVKEKVRLEHCRCIGVIDDTRRLQVRELLDEAGITLDVQVQRDWYFLGQ